MRRVHTHYDNLKVSRDAPQEVIRAAYRMLSQKYHPDRNVGDPNAARIMSLINTSFEVLSDPAKRAQHDKWIRSVESDEEKNQPTSEANVSKSSSSNLIPHGTWSKLSVHLRRYWIGYALLLIFGWSSISSFSDFQPYRKSSVAVPELSKSVSTENKSENPFEDLIPKEGRPSSVLAKKDWDVVSQPQSSRYTRPSIAPNGQPWPSTTAYISGFKRLYADGLSTVVVDNSKTGSDVFVKLYNLDSEPHLAIRIVLIKAHDKFKISSIRKGKYDIRFLNLDTGTLLKSEQFNLQEIRTEDGISYSNVKMTLYDVPQGNMDMTPITPEEF